MVAPHRGERLSNLLFLLGKGIFSGAEIIQQLATGKSKEELRLGFELSQELKRQKQLYSVMLSKLRAQKLVEERNLQNGKLATILTSRGWRKLERLQSELKVLSRLPSKIYVPLDEKKIIIVSFDVPEKQRRKRDWLRSVLQNLGLQKVHQSVWMGRQKLPKEFIDDLRTYRIIEFVEIFEVTKTGTLRHVR